MTALSTTDIYNLALSAIGHKRSIVAGQASREAELCDLWFPRVVSQVSMAAHWSCLKATTVLALLATRDTSITWDATQPMPPWTYAYAKPSDCLYPRYLADYSRFEMGRFGADNAVCTDTESAVLIYTQSGVATSLWSEDFTRAITHSLAAMIGKPLTGKRIQSQESFQVANQAIMDAQVLSANEDTKFFDSIPDWLSARGISGPLTLSRYIYPVGPMIAVPSDG